MVKEKILQDLPLEIRFKARTFLDLNLRELSSTIQRLLDETKLEKAETIHAISKEDPQIKELISLLKESLLTKENTKSNTRPAFKKVMRCWNCGKIGHS